MELTGKIIAVLPERGGTSARTGSEWKLGTYVLETMDQYPRKMCFEVFGADRIQQFNIQLGEILTVSFDIDAHEYQGRWFNGIRAFRVDRNVSAPVAAPGEATSAKVPSLKDEDMKALKDGIADLAKTASQFAELGKVAQTGVKLGEKLEAAGVATEAYSSKMSAAGAAVDSYAAATANLAQSYTQVSADMKSVADETKAYKQGVADMGQKLASLNSVYELQLQALNAQTEAQKAVTASAKEAAEAQAAFAAGTKQLHKQVADLNSIYGNMLNALA